MAKNNKNQDHELENIENDELENTDLNKYYDSIIHPFIMKTFLKTMFSNNKIFKKELLFL